LGHTTSRLNSSTKPAEKFELGIKATIEKTAMFIFSFDRMQKAHFWCRWCSRCIQLTTDSKIIVNDMASCVAHTQNGDVSLQPRKQIWPRTMLSEVIQASIGKKMEIGDS